MIWRWEGVVGQIRNESIISAGTLFETYFSWRRAFEIFFLGFWLPSKIDVIRKGIDSRKVDVDLESKERGPYLSM